MRILLAADPMIPVPPPGYGGIERIVDSLATAYRAAGHAVALVARRGSTCAVDALFPWPHDEVHGLRATWGNARALARATAAFHPDVVHSFARLAYLTPLLPARVPKVMSYQRHTGGRGVTFAARLGGRRLRFTGCSAFISTMGRRAGGTWSTIYNFADVDRIHFVPHVPADAPLVFLSRVESIKGPHLAIAMAKAAGRRLLIAGNCATSGPELAFWEREIAPHLGRDGIEFVGEVGDAAKDELLGRAAALVVPVQWDEPFGIVFAESLAAGTPVITCPRGALPEIVTPGRTGFFAETVTAGADAVRQLGELNRAACRAEAEARFSLAVCARHYLALYAGLLSS